MFVRFGFILLYSVYLVHKIIYKKKSLSPQRFLIKSSQKIIVPTTVLQET